LKNFLKGDLVKLFTNSFFTKEKDQVNLNNKLEIIDLSLCKFGYSGIESLSNVLKVNKNLKNLNLYKNLFDVNGARRLSEALLENGTLEVLDVGYNRIRDLGFTQISESLLKNPNTKIKEISFRCNFIKADIITNVIHSFSEKKPQIEVCNFSNNLIDEISANKIYKTLYEEGKRSKINSDIFEICFFNSPERLERCAWITCVNFNTTKLQILSTFENMEKKLVRNEATHLGVILDMKFFQGKRYIDRSSKTKQGYRIFLEFVDPNSVNRLLKIVSQEGFVIGSEKVKIFKAGMKKEVVIPKKKH
jgi:hypothetical protein